MTERQRVRDALAALTGREPALYQAPGRVNIIGEHVDYSEGFVLPIAIDRATFVAAAPRDDRTVRAYSIERDQTVTFELDEAAPVPRGSWSDYVQGTALALARRGMALRGADLAIGTTLPVGAGLASSAALEIVAALALSDVAGERLEPLDVAHACREAENDFVGLRSGIMDQLASVCGRRDHAVLIDCRSERTSDVPWALAGTAIVVCDSHVKHALAGSAYNERRADCEEAAKLLRNCLPAIATLRDVSPADFLRFERHLPPALRRRARHVVTENVRVLQAVAAVRARDAATVGARMNESHDSLRDDFEVSSPELDVLVGAARTVPGVYGSRMTGGGFGGSAVSLVRRDALPAFRAAVTASYRAAYGREPAILEVHPSAGAARIS